MKVLKFIFIRAPRKIFRIIFYTFEYYYYRFFYSKPKIGTNFTQKRYLICGGKSIDDIADTYREIFPGRAEAKISEADFVCEHIFDLLGSGSRKLSQEGDGYQPIDWHSDFKSSYRWNTKTFYRNIRFGNTKGVDVKVPWELSRFQHLNILGQAYILTGDKKYAKEFENQIIDWIKNNPFCFGINWTCTMDVAIRASNWLIAMEYFADKDLFSQDFLKEFYASIYEHGKFIRNHLEYQTGFTSNHLLADLAGLFFISVYCPFFKESKKWQDFSVRELSREIEKQVYSDGCNFEASTSYHRLVLEVFCYCDLLAGRAGISVPKKFKDKLKKMFEVSLYCIKPNGMIPQIGDNDNGRFLIFAKRPILEHKYLLTLAAIYYKDSSFKLPYFSFDEEAFWIFGKKGKEIYANLPHSGEPLVSKSFPDAGWFVIRHINDYCFISCGQNGQNGNGGHAHNDKLSFELVLNGQDIIVDPGTYVYTPYPDERNKFRSTGYHNTVKFDDYEQNEIPQNGIFSLFDRVEISNATLTESKDEIKYEAGIQYLDITHKRAIILDKKSHSWKIVDNISSLSSVKAKLIFHLSPNLTVDRNDILLRQTKDKIASIKVKESNLVKNSYDYSPEYGVKVRAQCLAANISSTEYDEVIETCIQNE